MTGSNRQFPQQPFAPPCALRFWAEVLEAHSEGAERPAPWAPPPPTFRSRLRRARWPREPQHLGGHRSAARSAPPLGLSHFLREGLHRRGDLG